MLIGGEDAESIDALAEVYAQWVPQQKILRTNLWSSELSKLTANAFLAQRISSINSIAAFCEASGADVREVARAIGTDSRIGSVSQCRTWFRWQLLSERHSQSRISLPALWFGGGCRLLGKCRVIEQQQHRIARLVVQKLFGTVTGKRLAILGFAFKADTNDTREAPAIRICRDLLEEGAQLAIHDPKVEIQQMARDLGCESTSASDALSGTGSWTASESVEDAVGGADAVLVLTEWSHYRDLNWTSLATRMRKPAWVFDARAVTKFRAGETSRSAPLESW